jgi:hypothetical protein
MRMFLSVATDFLRQNRNTVVPIAVALLQSAAMLPGTRCLAWLTLTWIPRKAVEISQAEHMRTKTVRGLYLTACETVKNSCVMPEAAQEAPPELDETAPTPVETSPPAVEMSPPALEMSPPAVEMDPPAVEMNPPSVEMSPPPVERHPPSGCGPNA